MSIQTKEKLNWLQQHLPEGLVVDSGWLEAHGYSRGLRQKYVTAGWLRAVAHGVYVRPHAALGSQKDELRWEHVVISVQTLLETPLIIGGRTALELQGFAHYLGASGPREVHLYGDAPAPNWLNRLSLPSKFVFHSDKLFANEPHTRALTSQLVDLKTSERTDSTFVQQPYGHWQWPLTMSSPERAVLQLLDEVPQRETFHQADMLMEGMRTLSPRKLHKLLVDCRSVKVKRLFLWFADRHNHPWLKQLDRSGIDLGHGKRLLARGGKLDPTYNITVPENIDAGG